jgi:hypothetical protein
MSAPKLKDMAVGWYVNNTVASKMTQRDRDAERRGGEDGGPLRHTPGSQFLLERHVALVLDPPTERRRHRPPRRGV